MSAATVQPELYIPTPGEDFLTGQRGRVFAPECILNHRYQLEQYPDFYFIVRHDQYSKEPELERICLYRQGVVNEYLRDDDKPFTN